MTETPAPLTPPDCDLQDFPFMPLHVARLRDSDMASEEAPEACWYAVLLWAASWHQLPAASLPANDAVLTKLIGLGRDTKTFTKHKAGALRGFVLCSDGRLYHPIVAEQALAAWDSKLQQRWRTECARIKKQNQRNETDLPQPTFEEFVAGLSPQPSPARPATVPGDIEPGPSGHGLQETGIGTETGTGTGRLCSVPDGTGAEPPLDELAEMRALPIATGSFRLAVKVLMERGGLSEARARPLPGKWNRDGLTPEELWKISEQAWELGTMDPVPYLTKAAADTIARRGLPGIFDAPEDRQRAWMAEFVDKPNSWRPGDRGPRPGHEGCRVSPEIQREFGVEPFSPRSAA